jgi:hypothetical protein
MFHGTEFRVVFFSAEWFRTEFREFASIFVPWYRISSIFILCGTVRNGIPRVFCSAEQPEFRQDKPIVPSIPSFAETNFCWKLPTLLGPVILKIVPKARHECTLEKTDQ